MEKIPSRVNPRQDEGLSATLRWKKAIGLKYLGKGYKVCESNGISEDGTQHGEFGSITPHSSFFVYF